MAKKGILLALSLAIAALPGFAQTPSYDFDVDTVTDGVQTSTSVNVNQQFLVQAVMSNADRLLGYSFDVAFDPGLLELVAVYENPGDLDFSGVVGLDEVGAAIDFFVLNQTRPEPWPLTATDINAAEQFVYPRDPVTDEGPRNGVVLDANGDNVLGLDEIGRIIDEFVIDQLPDDPDSRALGKTTYWTDIAAARTATFDYNESVEIADPPAMSNTGGSHPGQINDITGVLLARPQYVDGGTQTRPGFGVSGNLVLVTLRFRAIAQGTATLSFVHDTEDPVYINEDFTSLDDVIPVTTTGSATVTINP